MKRIIMTATLLSLASFAHANFTFHSNIANACDHVPGHWAGKGKATNRMIECTYHGYGTSSALDSAGKFTMELVADKDSGSFLCPGHAEKKLVGVCVNGEVTLMTDYGNLIGGFTENMGDATGELSIGLGMGADVSLHFDRVG